MTRHMTKPTLDVPDRDLILDKLLTVPTTGTDLVRRPTTALATHQAQTLDRRSPETLALAKSVGVELEYRGVQPLFKTPRIYTGTDGNDWTIEPLYRDTDCVVPKDQQAVIRKLLEADLDFRMLYIAHEVEGTKTEDIVRATDTAHTDITPEKVGELVGPVPAPQHAVTLGDRLNQRTAKTLTTIKKGAKVGGMTAAGIVAAPVVMVGAAVAALAQMDPIILGVEVIGEPRVGQPGAFYVVTRWDW